jgi:hypothetical protein
MTKNPILDELRKTREKLLADAGGTMAGLVARLQEDERASGREFVEPQKPHGESRTDQRTTAK